MKIFVDTEFYEFQPTTRLPQDDSWYSDPAPLLGANAVQLISIGAVREDGAEFYAENADFDWDVVPADHWLQDNVRPHLYGADRPGFLRSSSEIAERFRYFTTTGPVQRPEFWGYYCDYDWVVICGLYGRMVDLPPGFPMYCLDLKQEMVRASADRSDLPAQSEQAHHALMDARWVRDAYDVIRKR